MTQKSQLLKVRKRNCQNKRVVQLMKPEGFYITQLRIIHHSHLLKVNDYEVMAITMVKI